MSESVVPATAANAAANEASVTAFAEVLVLSRVFENMLKKPENDDEDSTADYATDQVNKSMALSMAQVATGFGE